jgi:hypothetical protein
MLSYANSFIDTVQGAKTQFLNTVVTEKSVREPLQAFVDAQTSFVKEIAKISDTVYNQTVSQVEKFTAKKV